jgi:hypothetical protein
VVRIVEDGKADPTDRATKVKQLMEQLVKKEEAALKAIEVAYGNFRKHYGNI